MARPYTPRVGDVVTYYGVAFTFNAVVNQLKPRPARVTVAGMTPTLKILSSGEVFVAVPRTVGRALGSWKSV